MNFGLLCTNARRQHSAEALTNCQWGAFVFKPALFLIVHPISIENMLQSKFFHVCGKEPQPGHIRDLISNYYTAVYF